MQIISNQQFKNLLLTKWKLENLNISLEKDFILDFFYHDKLEINDCTFSGGSFNINIKKGFEPKISILNSRFNKLSIIGNVETLVIDNIEISDNRFEISRSNINNFEFKFNSIDYDLFLTDLKVTNRTNFNWNRFINDSRLFMMNCNLLNRTEINENEFSDLYILNSEFQNKLYFKGNQLNNDNSPIHFVKCIFGQVEFRKSVMSHNTQFEHCTFQELTSFEYIRRQENSIVNIHNCRFLKTCYFDYAELYLLDIKNTIFADFTSFQNTIFNHISLNSSVFEKTALFDDIKLTNISKCHKKTLRIIKQQLQKAENRIDYNRFRSYELSAYFRELKWNWNDGKDKFILGATWLVTGFDHSWRRALGFTLLAGLLLYSLFYLSENYYQSFSIYEWQSFVSGYFRFFLVTDFYNPLVTDSRTYIDNTNTIGWLLFIFGKIVIAFGIYEMIQAFRKFKA